MYDHRGGWRPPGPRNRGFARFMVFGFMGFVLFITVVPGLIGFAVSNRFGGGRLTASLIPPIIVVVILVVLRRRFGRTFRSVRNLVDATGRLAEGDYQARVDPEGPSSLLPVIHSFNRMAERLESEDERRRDLFADLGHELRTPLTILQGRIEAMRDGVHPRDHEHVSALLEDVAVMDRLLEDLRTLSLSQAGALSLHKEFVSLDALVSEVASAYRSPGVTVAVVGSSGDPVYVDPIRIREVVSNLMSNARAAVGDIGTIDVVLGRSPDSVELSFSDDGIGIPASELGSVFQRFHKSDMSSGTGIGLTLAQELVEAHGGSVEVESIEGAGATFAVSLPLVSDGDPD